MNFGDVRNIEDYSYGNNKLQNSKKKSVVLFGCSFTYGQHLEDKYAFHSVLSKYTKRNVYNLGICGGSPRESLYLLRDKQIINQTVQNQNVEYVIYTYIQDQKRRLYTDITGNVPHFKKTEKGNALKFYNRHSYLYRTYTYRNITNYIYMNFIKDKDKYNLLRLYIKEINQEIKKTFGENTKFVILIYDDEKNDIQFFNSLSKEGLIIIDLNNLLHIDLDNNKYKISENDSHPNSKAWEVIVPALVKELKL